MKSMPKTMFVAVLIVVMGWAEICGAAPEMLTLDLRDTSSKVSYKQLLSDLIDKSKGNDTCEGIQMLQKPLSPPEYIAVNILAVKGTKDVTLSVAINKTNLYVLGYADPDTRTAYFVKDDEVALAADIFPGVSKKVNLSNIESRYDSLEPISGLKRYELQMNFENFVYHMLSVHGKKKIDDKAHAKFLLYAAQAISEGTRFAYVRNKFVVGTAAVPDYKAPRLENKWGALSKLIKTAKNKKFEQPLELLNPDGSPWKVDNVDQVKKDMSVLLFVPSVVKVTDFENYYELTN